MFKKVLLIISVFLFISCSLFEKDEIRDFSTESWINNPNERYEMAEDLLSNYLYIGMSKIEVTNLLGDTHYEYDNKFEYKMGSSGLGRVYFLYIEFDYELVKDFYKEKRYL